MQTLRRGLLAGFLASLVLAMFDFVTVGAPGNGLPSILHWFGIALADPTLSRWVGFFLLIVLGGVVGLIFGALQRDKLITAGRALLTGLGLGVLWWLIFELVLTNIMNHASSPFSLSFGRFLSSFPLDVLFGVLLGRSTSNGRSGISSPHSSGQGVRALDHFGGLVLACSA